ncbi:MAG: DUF3141 domain-containing protein [Desulfamplus sp.]|nr:DUF3141 domain-containing protein [Desulfamplus sp.]
MNPFNMSESMQKNFNSFMSPFNMSESMQKNFNSFMSPFNMSESMQKVLDSFIKPSDMQESFKMTFNSFINPAFIPTPLEKISAIYEDGYDYMIDAAQRSTLFLDILRKRGNGYLEHLHQGQPPVLVFDYEVISDGRKREKPVNYQLVRIVGFKPEAHITTPPKDKPIAPNKRPIVVMDPRAGHGPGIGGSKMDSQIGVAMRAGYPVYFMMFFTEPMRGQTIADVQQCQVHFLEEVFRLHPNAPKPAIIGNCQAGWAASLVAADRPDVTGPLVLNGSPLSYWGGVKGGHPMRYRGGLFGGSWLSSLSSDLGNGKFDGAQLVEGFEGLNPANTLWSKLYNVYSKVDTEEQRFLDFEKWWGGFFLLSREEIHFIVSHLFISDKLQQGFLKLHEDRYINLKNFKSPILVFASKGDNITPPQQALNWIPRVYKTTEEIKKFGQVIIYMLHDDVGHLGIFVSSKVNQKEHKEIIGCVEAIEFLSPGLYEMVIQEAPSQPWLQDHGVKFIERDIKDITDMDDGEEEEEAFQSVSSISSFNDKMYQDFLSPWVRMFSSEFSAEIIRQMHPLRVERYIYSDMNPMMRPIKSLVNIVKAGRFQAKKDNAFTKMEKHISDMIVDTLDLYRETRDNLLETMFYSMYGNNWSKSLFFNPESQSEERDLAIKKKKTELFEEIQTQFWHTAMKKGGFEEAIIRIIVAVTKADSIMGMSHYGAAEAYIRTDERFKKIKFEKLKNMIREQSAIMEKDKELALATLADLLPDKEDRITAVEFANAIANADDNLNPKEISVLKTIETVLLKDVFSFPSVKKDEEPVVDNKDDNTVSVKKDEQTVVVKKDDNTVNVKKDEQTVVVKKNDKAVSVNKDENLASVKKK